MSSRRFLLLYLAFVVEGGLAIAAVALGAWLGVPVAGVLAWDWPAIGWGTLGALPWIAAFRALLSSGRAPLRAIRRSLEEHLGPLIARAGLVEIAVVSLLAGVGEELFFRALLQGGLQPRFGEWGALFLASALFGVFHPLTVGYVVGAFVVGLFLGKLWLVTGSLAAPIACHAVYDFAALWIFRRVVSASPPPPSPGP